MQLDTIEGLPVVSLRVQYGRESRDLSPVLIDTGSVSTILCAEAVRALGIQPEEDDPVFLVRGIGGTESVFSRRVDRVQVGAFGLSDVYVEVGGMDYGIPLQGIVGMDLLRPIRAVIDLGAMRLLGGDGTSELPSG